MVALQLTTNTATTTDLQHSLSMLKALTGGERLRIIEALMKAETCVCDLDHLGIEPALLSYHLRKLRESGLVRTRRDAQWIYYSIDPDAWRAFATPLATFFGTIDLPPEAAYGAGQRCEPISGDAPGCGPDCAPGSGCCS